MSAQRPSDLFKNKTNVNPVINRATQATAEDFQEAGVILEDHATILDNLARLDHADFEGVFASLGAVTAAVPQPTADNAFAIITTGSGNAIEIARFIDEQWQIQNPTDQILLYANRLAFPATGVDKVWYIDISAMRPYLWFNNAYNGFGSKPAPAPDIHFKNYFLPLTDVQLAQQPLGVIADAILAHAPWSCDAGQKMQFYTIKLIGDEENYTLEQRFYLLNRNVTEIPEASNLEIGAGDIIPLGKVEIFLENELNQLVVPLGNIGTEAIEDVFNQGDGDGFPWMQKTFLYVTATQTIEGESVSKRYIFDAPAGNYGGDDLGEDPEVLEAFDYMFKDITDQPTAAASSLTNISLVADQANATISVLDQNGNVLSVLPVGFLNNEGTTFFYNEATEKLELQNDAGEVLSEIPVSAFVSNLAASIALVGQEIQLKDTAGNVLSSFTLTKAAVGLDKVANKTEAEMVESGDIADALANRLKKTGETSQVVKGKVIVRGNAVGADSVFDTYNEAVSSYLGMSNFIAPNAPNNSRIFQSIGKSASLNNRAVMQFAFFSSGNDQNYYGIGFFGNDDVLKILANNNAILKGKYFSGAGNSDQWQEAFAKKINAISITGDTNKTITITREDGTTLTASFLDNGGEEFPDDVLNTLSFNLGNDGVLRAVTSEGAIITVSLDGRYSLLGHLHTIAQIAGLEDALAEKISATNLTERIIFQKIVTDGSTGLINATGTSYQDISEVFSIQPEDMVVGSSLKFFVYGNYTKNGSPIGNVALFADGVMVCELPLTGIATTQQAFARFEFDVDFTESDDETRTFAAHGYGTSKSGQNARVWDLIGGGTVDASTPKDFVIKFQCGSATSESFNSIKRKVTRENLKGII
ncbi:hypothetical protein [Aequorivita echinoideorum]|uniref:DUF4815 domain-containing protein n=1 Tax=Aequorivita echinoideorum TaxID=1549647 RepID=A0ABS5S718_9FLAO|nr:hypothetical protein [Aequorivita echinoideorum]MBT0607645.1 hypothetical protein [Aequorivita echinoideorum]